ncbi:lytic transglycosylase domain-containing protein, partial [Anaeromyxobacter terrae]|uniref:lytic transglycosylase domain-containing protein n=1 Tax=Anaeromyxobacter terrae TaxID=2925406 RepID=UPI001F5A93B6
GALLARGRPAAAGRHAARFAAAMDESDRRGALLVLARAAARAGRVDEASRRYSEIAALRAPIPGIPEWRQRDLGDEAAYLSAWLYYDAGQFARAATALESFAKANRRSRRADDARWFAAWSLYRLGRFPAAARALAKLERTPYADAAAYWRARLARSGADQRRLYRATIAAGGDGWYGLLARARLAALGEPAARMPPPDPRPLPELQDASAAARLAVAVELLGLGLRAEALDELGDLTRSWRARPSAPVVAQLAAFAGDAEVPFRISRDHLLPTRRALRWAHPEPYPELVPVRARAVGVDPSLLLAVMRRESGFRPGIRSGAGAEGLLQLRPATAERVAALLGLPGGLGARLAEPEVNITLGAHYLGLLLARFRDPALAVAAYNAGPGPAAEWARARAGMPLDAWVESIPYRETRGYVRIVLADWDVYRALAGEPAAPIAPERPVAAPDGGVAF